MIMLMFCLLVFGFYSLQRSSFISLSRFLFLFAKSLSQYQYAVTHVYPVGMHKVEVAGTQCMALMKGLSWSLPRIVFTVAFVDGCQLKA